MVALSLQLAHVTLHPLHRVSDCVDYTPSYILLYWEPQPNKHTVKTPLTHQKKHQKNKGIKVNKLKALLEYHKSLVVERHINIFKTLKIFCGNFLFSCKSQPSSLPPDPFNFSSPQPAFQPSVLCLHIPGGFKFEICCDTFEGGCMLEEHMIENYVEQKNH